MNEDSFILQLENKAEEQRRLIDTQILPEWARGIGEWLVVNPWRVLIPLSGILYILLRIVVGQLAREVILGLFGGFRI